jgi:hypothetical protein
MEFQKGPSGSAGPIKRKKRVKLTKVHVEVKAEVVCKDRLNLSLKGKVVK